MKSILNTLLLIVIFYSIETSSIIHQYNTTNDDRNLKTILLEYPDIFLIGSMKSGTGSFHKLVVDSSLGKVCGYGEKEKHFFNSHDYVLNYKSHVAHYISQFSGCKTNQLTMDSTPGYSVNDDTTSRVVESYTAEELAKKKFIFLIREPVARHYSEYQMSVRNCQDLEGHLNREDQAEGKSRIGRWVDACNGVAVNPHWSKKQNITIDHSIPKIMTFAQWIRSPMGIAELRRGKYFGVIKKWLQIIRRDQLFILNFKSIVFNTTDVLQRTFNYFGLNITLRNVSLPEQSILKRPNTTLDCESVDILTKYFNRENDGLLQFLSSSKKNIYEPQFGEWDDTKSKCIGKTKFNSPSNTYDDDFFSYVK